MTLVKEDGVIKGATVASIIEWMVKENPGNFIYSLFLLVVIVVQYKFFRCDNPRPLFFEFSTVHDCNSSLGANKSIVSYRFIINN